MARYRGARYPVSANTPAISRPDSCYLLESSVIKSARAKRGITADLVKMAMVSLGISCEILVDLGAPNGRVKLKELLKGSSGKNTSWA